MLNFLHILRLMYNYYNYCTTTILLLHNCYRATLKMSSVFASVRMVVGWLQVAMRGLSRSVHDKIV